jgi:hypothetical protein
MELEPGHAEDGRVVAEAGDVELDGLRVGADLESNGSCFLGESTGGDGASVNHLELSWHGFGLQRDVVALGKGNVEERGRGPGVDQRKGRKSDILDHEVNGQNNVFFRIKTKRKDRQRISSGWNIRDTGALRAERETQRSALYHDWVGSFPGDSAVARVTSEARAGWGGALASSGHAATEWPAPPQYMHRLFLRRCSFSWSVR